MEIVLSTPYTNYYLQNFDIISSYYTIVLLWVYIIAVITNQTLSANSLCSFN